MASTIRGRTKSSGSTDVSPADVEKPPALRTLEEALQQLAERFAEVENALMQAGTARLSAEADPSRCVLRCRRRVSHRLSTTLLWQPQWRRRLLQHRRRLEQNHVTSVLSRSWKSFGRSGLAGTTAQRCCSAKFSKANSGMHTEMLQMEGKTTPSTLS